MRSVLFLILVIGLGRSPIWPRLITSVIFLILVIGWGEAPRLAITFEKCICFLIRVIGRLCLGEAPTAKLITSVNFLIRCNRW